MDGFPLPSFFWMLLSCYLTVCCGISPFLISKPLKNINISIANHKITGGYIALFYDDLPLTDDFAISKDLRT